MPRPKVHPLTCVLRRMLRRCHVPSNPDYKYYGGRGIFVCDAWRGPGGVESLAACVGSRPSPKHSIDRIDNAKGYEPGNVRWATMVEQNRNKRNNLLITIGDRTQTATAWAIENNVPRGTAFHRIRSGWPKELAVTLPVTGKGFRRVSPKGRTIKRLKRTKPKLVPDLKPEPTAVKPQAEVKKEAPVKPKIKPRSVVFPIRLSAAEKRALTKAAAVAKKRPSAFVRDLVLSHLTPAVTPAASHT